MCGIAGFFNHHDRPAEEAPLTAMCSRLIHRGPDGGGAFRQGPVALGHRRLSIVDVAGGQQPIANESGSVVIVFNGEIYNFPELRENLQKRGHHFRTRTDTEVIVHLYEEAGERTPEYLNGMFAFAIWDQRRRQLFLARDRMGKKPLYYSTAVPGMALCFASELKALTVLPECPRALDLSSFADFLSLSYVPDPRTIYKDIHKLAPAHSLTVSGSGIQLRRYWKPDFAGSDLSFDAAVHRIAALSDDAVRCRMISDVPLGAFLSGGVDSSAAVGFMARHTTGPVKTFSIGFTDKRFDELRFARVAATLNRTHHHEQTVSPSIHDALHQLTEYFDEPFGDSSAIPMLYLSRMTRQHVTVALTGDGADEIFGGYRRYYYGVLEESWRQRLPRAMRRHVLGTAARFYPKFDYLPRPLRARTLLGNLAQDLPDAYFTSMSAFRDSGLTSVLSGDVSSALHGYSGRHLFRDLAAQAADWAPLQQMQFIDFHTWLPGGILVKADRTTMACSLESRSPWLDYRLVELACSLPPAYNLHRNTGKYVFKEAVSPVVPGSLLQRTKMGFSVPLASWFRSSLRPVFESAVLGNSLKDFLSLDEVRHLWQEHQSGVSNHERKLWNLLVFACWQQRHLQNRNGQDGSRGLEQVA